MCRHLDCDCGDEHYCSDYDSGEGCPSQLNQGNEGQLLSPTFLGCKPWVRGLQTVTVFLNGARKGILNSHACRHGHAQRADNVLLLRRAARQVRASKSHRKIIIPCTPELKHCFAHAKLCQNRPKTDLGQLVVQATAGAVYCRKQGGARRARRYGRTHGRLGGCTCG